MSVEQAEAQLVLAKAEDAYLKAKAAYQKDPDKRAAFQKARDEVVAARDEWRNNHRLASPGTAVPGPLSVGLEVK